MTVYQLVYEYLSTRTSVGDDLYPQGSIPQPAPEQRLTFLRVDEDHYMTQSGPAKLTTPRVQITAWAPDRLAAMNLGAEVIQELEGVTITSGDHILKRGEVIVDRDDYDPNTEEFSRIVEFEFDWEDISA